MSLDEVIKLLNELKEQHGGDVPVFVNGEHGERQPEKAHSEHFALGEAEIILGFDKEDLPEWLSPRDKAMQIGGY